MNISKDALVDVILQRAVPKILSAPSNTPNAVERILHQEASIVVGARRAAGLVSLVRQKCVKVFGLLGIEKCDQTEEVTMNVPNTKEQVGERIRTLRQGKELTQAQLASLAGIEPANLSRIENGHSDPGISTVLNLLSTMECSLRDLVEVEEAKATIDS